MLPLIQYILRCARRDKIFLSCLLGIVISFIVCVFLGGTAASEQDQMKIVYSAGIFRLIFIYGFAIFNTFLVSRMVQNKEIETFLAGPISRHSIVLSLIIANTLLLGILIIFSGGILKLSFWNIIPINHILFWCLSIFFETLIIIAITIFFSLNISSITLSIFFITIFYITSRIMGFVLTSITISFQGFSFFGVVKSLIIPISIFFPRLDLFSQSTWLIYNDSIQNITLIIFQSLIYIPLLILACIVDFNKKSL